ncbi:MAG: hypothetical protein U0165_08950 [Polyangiaceae bacterium]
MLPLSGCSSEDSPASNGAAGNAGQGGTSGNAGSSGTAGTAGTGGASGASGTAGTGAAGAGGSAGSGGTAGGAGTGGTSGSGGTGGTGGVIDPNCTLSTGPHNAGTTLLVDPSGEASVSVEGTGCERTFTLSSTAPLRDNFPANPRVVVEPAGQPSLQTGHILFDALYALALGELAEASVDQIHDSAFNQGQPIACPAGGCFETGRLWTYVWTRDTSYAADLGLATYDATRAKNSLEFKLSTRRDGTNTQIVQDTGTGGSYPVSSDRVIWALGAKAVLAQLTGAERAAFATQALTAIVNTTHHDRQVIFDASTGLYSGETSFLDWREQSYASWTANNPVHIAMSRSLSTNIAHLIALETGRDLATEQGDATTASELAGWASDLRSAIETQFTLPSGMLSTYVTTYLNPAPSERLDLLSSALAVLNDIGTQEQQKKIVSSYPHLLFGAPVIWPQQKETPIYHNRAIWPFVTAYWAKAAAKVSNDAAVAHAVNSLLRGAALNLSNMENLELVSGTPYVDDGVYSGPVVNSQRQLWSVAGYVAMVHEVLFGVKMSSAGVRFDPFMPLGLRNALFAASDTLALNRVKYHGKSFSVVLVLPEISASLEGGARVSAIKKNGVDLGAPASVLLDETSLNDGDVIELVLGTPTDPQTITQITNTSDYKNLFGPRSPTMTSVALEGGGARITWDSSGEIASEVTFDVLRDGQIIASSLDGSVTSYLDTTVTSTSPSYCYSVRAHFASSGNPSQDADPACFWGSNRIDSFAADQLMAVGGMLSSSHGRIHQDVWGDEGHTLTLASYTPTHAGRHLIQVVAGNGSGPINTGITCGVKRIVVHDLADNSVVGTGVVVMPQLGSWDSWGDSSFVPVDLDPTHNYSIELLGDDTTVNMSEFEHFATYNGGEGGTNGPFSRVNVAEIKVLALEN